MHYLCSEHVGDEFKIFIGHCGGSDDVTPVALYVADGNGMFLSTVDIVRLMQLSAHLPPILVVGIGYRMGSLEDTVSVHARDLTPTPDAFDGSHLSGRDGDGWRAAFLGVHSRRAQPWVRSRYRVDAEDSAYFGHSLGGLFGTFVLLTSPDTFRKYSMGSPSLWWDDDMIFDYEVAYADAHDDLPAKVFFTVRAFEDHDGRQREASRLPAEKAEG